MSVNQGRDSNKRKLNKPKSPRRDFLLHGLSRDVHDSLSRGGRNVFYSMQYFANRSGELRLPNGHWIERERIMHRAKISSKNTFGKYSLELRQSGLCHVTQPIEVIARPDGSRHMVFFPARYCVSKTPRQDWISCVSQSRKPHRHRGPCVSQFPSSGQNPACVSQDLGQRKDWDTNSFQTTPPAGASDAGVGVSASSFDKNEGHSRSSSVSVTSVKANSDDDSRDIHDRSELLLQKATEKLVARGHHRDYVEMALEFLDQRAFDFGKTAATADYYITCFDTLQHNSSENDYVWSVVKHRRELRQRFGVPSDLTKIELTEEQERLRQEFNKLQRLTPT